MNTPNQIPEEVLKGMQEDANRYSVFKHGEGSDHQDDIFYVDYVGSRTDYLQGRQDEWERKREEVERLKGLINWAWRKAIYYCEEQGESDGIRWEELHGWEAFKTKHNL